jgi:hypothetical protein
LFGIKRIWQDLRLAQYEKDKNDCRQLMVIEWFGKWNIHLEQFVVELQNECLIYTKIFFSQFHQKNLLERLFWAVG